MGCMVRIGCLVFVVGRVYLLGHEETGESGIISAYGSKAVYRESFGASLSSVEPESLCRFC